MMDYLLKIKSIALIALMTAFTTNAQKLKKGNKAPSFKVNAISGEEFDLKKLNIDGKTVFISFMRYAGCPVCNLRVHELSDKYDELKAKNIEMIVVFESSEKTLKEYISNADLSIPIIADPKNLLYDLYGVKKSLGKVLKTALKKKARKKMKKGKKLYGDNKYKRDGALTRIPADFVIDPSGLITTAYYGSYIGDHLDLSSITK